MSRDINGRMFTRMSRLAHDFQCTSVSSQASLASNAKPLCCLTGHAEAAATVLMTG